MSLADRVRCRAGISTCTASLRSAGGNRIADLDLAALIGADLAGRFAVTRRYGKWAGYGRLWPPSTFHKRAYPADGCRSPIEKTLFLPVRNVAARKVVPRQFGCPVSDRFGVRSLRVEKMTRLTRSDKVVVAARVTLRLLAA